MSKPRGIRNNNPLNIRLGSQWHGLRRKQTDKNFCQFITIEYGYRAAFRLFKTYYDTYSLRNLSSIIGRWAPPTENNTDIYVETVKNFFMFYTGKMLNEAEELPRPEADSATWCAIVRAMTAVECGAKWAHSPYVPSSIKTGWLMAFDK